MKLVWTAIMALAAVSMATPAEAVFIEYEFNGTVQNDPSDSIVIRNGTVNPDPYTGDPIAFPYQVGEVISFAFHVLLPVGSIRPPADGIYRFRPALSSGSPDAAQTGFTVRRADGSLDQDFRAAVDLNDFGYELIYNSNPGIPDAQRLTLDISGGRTVQATLRGPGYELDPTTGNIGLGAGGRCDERDREGCSGLSIGEFDASVSGIPIVQIDPQSSQPFPKGFFSEPLRLSGQWSVPVVSDNNPTPVPAPSALLLLGIALSSLAWRYRSNSMRKV